MSNNIPKKMVLWRATVLPLNGTGNDTTKKNQNEPGTLVCFQHALKPAMTAATTAATDPHGLLPFHRQAKPNQLSVHTPTHRQNKRTRTHPSNTQQLPQFTTRPTPCISNRSRQSLRHRHHNPRSTPPTLLPFHPSKPAPPHRLPPRLLSFQPHLPCCRRVPPVEMRRTKR